MESLADSLGIHDASTPDSTTDPRWEDITDADKFAAAVVESREFRQYIVSGLVLGNLPGFTSILGRLMDRAWGKAPERVEHTGKDGRPIESVTEVRRIIVRVSTEAPVLHDEDEGPVTTH